MNLFRYLKSFYRRGKYGWDYTDCFSMDEYLSRIIPQMLRHLATKNSCPYKFYDPTSKNDECLKWKENLISISEGFEKYNSYTNSMEFSQKELRKNKKELDKSLKLFSKYFLHLWW